MATSRATESGLEPPAEGPEPARLLDLRLMPVAVSAWLSMMVVTVAPGRIAVGLAVLSLCGALLAWRWRRWLLVAILIVTACCAASGGVRAWQLHEGPVASLARERATVEADIEIAGEPRWRAGAGRPDSLTVDATVVSFEGRGSGWRVRTPVIVVVTGDAVTSWRGVTVGSRVRCVGALAPADASSPAGAVFNCRAAPVVLAPPGPVLVGVERVRRGLREAVEGQPPQARALLPALVVGDTSHVDESVGESFRASALTHLSAVSGSNLALLLSATLGLAALIGIRGRWLHVVALVSVAAFVLLCRGEPSVVRAAAMGVVTLAAIGSPSRGGAGLRSLCLATTCLLLFDPWLCRSWGFALSVAACVGIIVCGRPWRDALARWCPGWLAGTVAIPLAAQVATQPLVTALSGSISLVGLLANCVAAPLVGPATLLGITAAIVAPWALPAARVVVVPGGWCAQAIVWIAQWSASLPGASLQWPATPVGLALLTAACVWLALVLTPLLEREWLVVAAAAVMILSLLRGPVLPGWPPSRWDVVMCDVGQGDALVAQAGPGVGVVVDVGPEPAALRRCLDSLGIERVPLLILTHDHADHTGGLDAVLTHHPDLVLESPLASAARGRIESRLRQAGAHPRPSGPGEVVDVGAVQWTTVSAGGGLDRAATGEGESSAENDGSLIGLLTVGTLTVLVTGDAEAGGQDAAVASGGRVACDVLKVPHHGSSRQSPDLFAATTARVALISVGAHNDYGHPTQKTLRLIATVGMTPARTDESGALAVAKVNGRLEVTTEHAPRAVANKRHG